MHDNWNKFVSSHPLGTIHQTSFWGDFQAKNPARDKYFVITLEEKNKIKAGGLLVRHKLPFGLSWLYCPRGPLCNYSSSKELKEILEKLKPIAKKEKAVFIRIDPPIAEGEKTNTPAGFKTAHAQYQPEHTLIIDLSLSEAEILIQMKPKGRYNIKVAQKHGVKIRKSELGDGSEFKKDLEKFYEILTQTCKRDGFSVHSKLYYENMLAILAPQNLADLYLAEYENKIIAGIITTKFKDTVTYYFGASDYEHRNLMAPYLLQWEALTQAKKDGFKFYDFLGIAPLDKNNDPIKNHHYSKITDFKLKFGGKNINYMPAQEIPLNNLWYWILLCVKKLFIH